MQQLYIPTDFWFSSNVGLAIPHFAIPYSVHIELDFIKQRKEAANRIYYWWKCILAKRRLLRLRVGNEIEVEPLVGIKYFEALDNYTVCENNRV